ncbi:MAG: hypothetical protein AABY15_03000 [Nanoarchaeota archaeon]
MKNLLLLLTFTVLLSSCVNQAHEYDGLVLTDENTGKKYLLQKDGGYRYTVLEQQPKVIDGDTTYVFQ